MSVLVQRSRLCGLLYKNLAEVSSVCWATRNYSSSDADLKSKTKLFKCKSEPASHSSTKISLIGAGHVNMACAICLLCQKITLELALVDKNKEKVEGEQMDLEQGASHMGDAKILSSTDYRITEGSKIAIISVSAPAVAGRKSRLDALHTSTKAMKDVVPKLVKYCPDAVIVVTTNPVDVMTYVAWKLSGFPDSRVLGSGTSLDTSRFKHFIAKRFNIAPSSVDGWIIGEHGDSSVPVWSGVNIHGMRLQDINPELGTDCDEEKWEDVHKAVVKAAYKIIRGKKYTNWAIALNVAAICKAILYDSRNIHAVTVNAKGLHGFKEDIFFSLPCVVGANGVTEVMKLKLSKNELKRLQKSAKILAQAQCETDL